MWEENQSAIVSHSPLDALQTTIRTNSVAPRSHVLENVKRTHGKQVSALASRAARYTVTVLLYVDVISKRIAFAKLTLPPLRRCVWDVQNA